jgi:predicted nucleotidyltransferase
MSTSLNPDLSSALFGRTRRAVLGWLYGHPDQSFYLRELARNTGAGLGAVQREVKRLASAGIIRRSARGREVYYQADALCPVFAELKYLIVKTSGMTDILRAALAPLEARIKVAFIYGSVARNEARQSSDVDVTVVGEVSFAETVVALEPAQAFLGREINPTVYPPSEWRAKLFAGHHFLTALLEEEKLFLIGDQGEFERLAETGPRQQSPKHPRRN